MARFLLFALCLLVCVLGALTGELSYVSLFNAFGTGIWFVLTLHAARDLAEPTIPKELDRE